MAFSIELPNRLTSFSKEYGYSSDQEMRAIIRLVAMRLASIYAAFLMPEAHPIEHASDGWKVDDLFFYFRRPDTFPPNELIEGFRKNLEEEIFQNLTGNTCLKLDTDAIPTGFLSTVLMKSSIDFQKYRLVSFFPHRTATWLHCTEKNVSIKMSPSSPCL